MIFITAFAVYKTLQIILALLPREVMPWVKVVAGAILSIGATALAWPLGDSNSFSHFVLFSLAVATLSGVTHSGIRLVTYLGDAAARRATK